ncbi:MAG: hypothetical protein ACOYMW_13420 [Candidatus Competibacteraceae bacterium]|jgi:hypothetical protein
MSVYALPNATAMIKTVAMLFGNEVKVTPGKPLDTKVGSSNLIAIYVDDDDKPVAAVLCDIPFAANAGCALSMLPAGAAKDAIKTKKLEQTMLDNLYEVMNILSALLIDEHTPHLKLTVLYPDLGKLPADARAALSTMKGHADFIVNVPRYGVGGLSLLVV